MLARYSRPSRRRTALRLPSKNPYTVPFIASMSTNCTPSPSLCDNQRLFSAGMLKLTINSSRDFLLITNNGLPWFFRFDASWNIISLSLECTLPGFSEVPISTCLWTIAAALALTNSGASIDASIVGSLLDLVHAFFRLLIFSHHCDDLLSSGVSTVSLAVGCKSRIR